MQVDELSTMLLVEMNKISAIFEDVVNYALMSLLILV